MNYRPFHSQPRNVPQTDLPDGHLHQHILCLLLPLLPHLVLKILQSILTQYNFFFNCTATISDIIFHTLLIQSVLTGYIYVACSEKYACCDKEPVAHSNTAKQEQQSWYDGQRHPFTYGWSDKEQNPKNPVCQYKQTENIDPSHAFRVHMVSPFYRVLFCRNSSTTLLNSSEHFAAIKWSPSI